MLIADKQRIEPGAAGRRGSLDHPACALTRIAHTRVIAGERDANSHRVIPVIASSAAALATWRGTPPGIPGRLADFQRTLLFFRAPCQSAFAGALYAERSSEGGSHCWYAGSAAAQIIQFGDVQVTAEGDKLGQVKWAG